jgi:hypothetical protein
MRDSSWRARSVICVSACCCASCSWICCRTWSSGRVSPAFFSIDADDVEAELRAHEIARLARLHREGGRLELGHHAPLAEEAEVAAVAADPSSSDSFLASAAKSAPPFTCASSASARLRTAASSLPSVFSRMWLAGSVQGVWYCWMLSL